MASDPTNEAAVQAWNSVPREARDRRVLEADFHRPLSACLNELAALGCRLREIAEPGLDPGVAEEARSATPGIESYVRLPNFLIVAAENR